MERLGIYKFLYFFTVVIFVLFNRNLVIDSVVAGVFIFSTIALLFRREVSSTDSSDQVFYPQVHYYQTSRYNRYTYSLVILVALVAFTFYLLQMMTNLRIGLITLILWPVIIIATQYISLKITKNLNTFLIVDYIKRELVDEEYIINDLVEKLLRLEIVQKKKIDDLIKENTDWDSSKRKIFSERFLEYTEYLREVKENELLSQEIEEINKR